VEFGLKQTNVQGTCFANGIMLQKVLVLWCGLYIALMDMIFCIALLHTRVSVHTKFGVIWSWLASTCFTKVQLDQKCKVDASITSGGWNWMKFGVAWLFGMVHMCINFHSQWTYIASTCFTMLPTDQKLKHDDALTWVVWFGSNFVWWSYLVVGSCPKSFKAFGITKHALASQCPFAAFKLWEFIVGVWLSNWL
jgi:hypothetical protein